MLDNFENTKTAESDLLYRSFFDKNPSPMWVYSLDTLKFLMVNDAAISDYGYSNNEFMDMTIKDIRPEEDIPILLENINNQKSTIQNSGTWRHKKKNGEIILVKISSHSILLNGGAARCVMALDVTEKVNTKRMLVKEVAKFKSIIESTSDLIFSVDSKYCYTSFNSAHKLLIKNLFNVDIEIGELFFNGLNDNELVHAKNNFDRALIGENFQEIVESSGDSSFKLFFEAVHNPIKDESGEIIGVSVFGKDITQKKRAMDQLAKREKEYQLLFNADLTGDFISTPDGRIILCNPKFLQIFGFNSEEEAYNTSALDLYKNPLDRAKIISDVIENKKIENFEIELLRRDGSILYALESIVGQFNENGNLEKFIGYVQDITDLRLTNKKVAHLSQAVEQSPVTIMITDVHGNIEYINRKGLEITGYSTAELLGKNPRVLSSGEKSKQEYEVLWNTIKSGNEWKGELHNKKKSGEYYWVSEAISPIKNKENEITNFLAVKEDITERKLVEAELIAAKEKAEEINKIKTIFFSNMSHELRTPLVGILGFADILSNSIEDESERAMASTILQSGKRLLNTLTSLMNLSELESSNDKIDLEELDINILCEDVFNNYIAHSSNPNVKFNASFCSDPILSMINERLFRESISQILNNAVTFTEHGFVLITTYKKSESLSGSKFGVIEIADTGIGIPNEKMNVVFEEFRQVSEGFGRNYEGTGLGLTLTKKYVEKMGGKIELQSQVDRGTRIKLTFPLCRDQENIIEVDIGQGFNSENYNEYNKSEYVSDIKNILIVENDEINKIFLEKCISKVSNYKSVSTGTDAIKVSLNQKFDLILMDINLGDGLNGIETTREIRKIPGYKETPIVAMTAYVEPESINEFLEKGCSHYISKPFFKRELIELVQKILVLRKN